jgi:hypothetical protein
VRTDPSILLEFLGQKLEIADSPELQNGICMISDATEDVVECTSIREVVNSDSSNATE